MNEAEIRQIVRDELARQAAADRVRPPMVDYLEGNLVVRLGDAGGLKAVRVFNSSGAEVVTIDSSGEITLPVS